MLDNPRQDFIKKLSSILIGPKTSDEDILANPCDQYLYGYLWPRAHNYSVKDLSFELEDDNLESTPSKYPKDFCDIFNSILMNLNSSPFNGRFCNKIFLPISLCSCDKLSILINSSPSIISRL